MSWRLNKSSEKFRNKWMWVTEDDVETETGHKMTWGVVHKNPAVLVIPWDGQNTYLIGQYRYPVDLYSWEFVQGHFEHESIEQAAVHELSEEAGLKAQKIELIGKFFLAPGHHTQEYYVYIAHGITEGEQNFEPDEIDIAVKKVSLGDIKNMIVDGKIKDGPSLAGFTIFETWRTNK